MKGRIIYLKQNKESVAQAQQAFNSFVEYGWEVEMVEGLTSETVRTDELSKQFQIMPSGRLAKFYQVDEKKFWTKRACAMNHVHFWKEVVSSGTPQVFIEHDAIAISPSLQWEFSDVLCLNLEHSFRFGALKGKFNWKIPASIEQVCSLPEDYPLKTKVEGSAYFGAKMIPGTAAYAITPKGAAKMLEIVSNNGLEQSDYMLNDMNVEISYANPAPVRFNTKNLRTSHG